MIKEDTNTNNDDYDYDDDIEIETIEEESQKESFETKVSLREEDSSKESLKNEHFLLPNLEEQSMIRGGISLMKSSIFNLKIEEMLEEIKINYSSKIILTLRKVLFSLKNFICDEMTMPAVSSEKKYYNIKDVRDIEEASNIKMPLINQIDQNSLLKFIFIKPESLFVVGSFILELLVKKKDKMLNNVDLVFEMPAACFQEKDHMNHRYFYKRSFYLSILALGLQEKFGNLFEYEFENFENDPLRPILLLKSTEENPMHFTKKGYCIRLIPQMPSSVFPLSKLAPTRNNVRPTSSKGTDISTTSAPLPPTPLYNASILSDMHMSKHTDAVHSALSSCPGMRDALLLFKVWCQQRHFTSSRPGFHLSGFLMSMLTTHLLSRKKGKRITKSTPASQIFKLTMDILATHDFTLPLFLTQSGEAKTIPATDFKSKVNIIDPSGTLNIASHLSASGIQEIQYEARLTLTLLNEDRDRFEDVFMVHVHREWVKYDNVFRIPLERDAEGVWEVLRKGLGDRVQVVAVWQTGVGAWRVDQTSQSGGQEVWIGLVFDAEASLRQVELGPLSNDKQGVEEFAQLWGEKAEMRRFQDGSIRECVVFECDGSLAQKSVLVARMTAYLLTRHFQVSERDGVVYWAGLGGKFIALPSPTMPGKLKQDVVKSFTPVMDALQEITRQIKALDLPLSIHRIHHCSDSLAYCSVFIPQPVEEHDFAPRCSHPEFLIEFENSGKWPDDVGAIETMKRAFYIQIANLLEESDTLAIVMVQGGADSMDLDDETMVGDHTSSSASNESFLQLTHSSGYTFNMRIHHPRVGVLLERVIKAAGTDFKTKSHLQAFHKSYIQRFVARPAHYHMIGNLCLRYPFLGTTIRLTKRWLASHLLLGPTCISGEVVDLICARVYTTPTAFGTPGSAWTGFVRVLDLIQSWRWNIEPLIVELQVEEVMAISVQDEINKHFASAALLRGGNAPILFVATELDTASTSFGSLDVSTKVVQRLCMLTKQSLNVVQNQLLTGSNNDVSQLFLTSYDGYDAVIQLDSTQIARYFESVTFNPANAPTRTSKFKNLMDAHDKQFLEHSRIDLVQLYLADLVHYFGECAMFFADLYGGDRIAVVWKRPFLEPAPFKINLGYLANVNAKTMSANKPAILSEMERMGGDLVLQVLTNTSK